MIIEQPEGKFQIQNAPYFTYFKGPDNIIFYSCGEDTHPDSKGIRAVAVYYPSEKGNRTQFGTSLKYSRLIINGFQEDKKLLKHTPRKTQTTILKLFAKDQVTKEPILRVPINQITEVYSPKNSLKNLLENPPNIPQINTVIDKLQYSIKLLDSYGIPKQDLGLYGSLQCGLFIDNLATNFNDIDYLVYGLVHQEKIVLVAKKHKFAKKYKRLDSQDDVGLRVEKRQLDLTEVHLAYKDQPTFLHLTQIRKDDDKDTVPDIRSLQIRNNTNSFLGTVIDSSESLTNPSVYTVKTKNDIVKVLNRYYRFTKAAYKGDVVEIKGVSDESGKYILLTKPFEHYIVTIA